MTEQIKKLKIEMKKEKLVNWAAVKSVTERISEKERKEFLANLYGVLIKAGVLSLKSGGNYEIVGNFDSQDRGKVKTKNEKIKVIHWGPYPHDGGNLYFTNKKDALDYLKAFYPQCLEYKTMWVKKYSKE